MNFAFAAEFVSQQHGAIESSKDEASVQYNITFKLQWDKYLFMCFHSFF